MHPAARADPAAFITHDHRSTRMQHFASRGCATIVELIGGSTLASPRVAGNCTTPDLVAGDRGPAPRHPPIQGSRDGLPRSV